MDYKLEDLTWEMVVEKAVNDPVLFAAVTRVRNGTFTREQGLVACILLLKQVKDNLIDERMDAFERGTAPVQLDEVS